ncbi:conserved hypothetical protein [Ricinus communis]|uniref:Uncharacterized protein n=1 Tax=Ricinus communis TaxID=3988 RepID=B9T599_RICCO|nr:conserved hypothetical protein [Ricinus communis]
MFNGDSKYMRPTRKLDRDFNSIDQLVIDRNNVNGMATRSTAQEVIGDRKLN